MQITLTAPSPVLDNNLTVSTTIPGKKPGFLKMTGIAVKIGFPLGALFAFSVTGFIIVFVWRKEVPKLEREDDFDLISGLPTRFSFEELEAATESLEKVVLDLFLKGS